MVENIFSIITIVLVVLVFMFYFFIKKREEKDWVYGIYFIITLFAGTTLYFLGLSYKQDSDATFSPLFLIARSFTYSIKSFGGDFGASATAPLAKENTLFEFAVFVHYFAAVILTFLVLLKLFGKNIINRIFVWINSFCSKYIIVGYNHQVASFINSLSAKKRKHTTIILEAKDNKIKSELMLEGLKVVTIKDDNKNSNLTTAYYDALKKAGFNRNKKDTRVIAMTKDDEINLIVAKIITDYIFDVIKPKKSNDSYLDNLTDQQEITLGKMKLFGYIMYETLERAEHFVFGKCALGRIRFLNSDEVRARKFILENPITSLIPKEWINTKKARLFNSSDEGFDKNYKIGNFFVGFGATNRHLCKNNICNYQLLNTDYNAIIFDKNAEILEKQFQNIMPGLFNKKDKNGKIINGQQLRTDLPNDVYYPNQNEQYNIEFVKVDVLSSEFYNKIFDEINGTISGNPYDFVSIVIALNSDKFSIETALELRQKLYERNLLKGADGSDRVRIFVKILKNGILTDEAVLNDKDDIDSKIVTFGAINEILNEKYIIHEQLDLLAKNIANDYWINAGAENQKANVITKWDTLSEFKRFSNRFAAMLIKTKLNLLGFDLIATKTNTTQSVALAYSELYNLNLAQQQRELRNSGTFVDFAIRDENGNILDTPRNNLARLEHLRWNTFYLVNGWTKLLKSEVTKNSRQNEKSKQHACITTFEGLSALRADQANLAINDTIAQSLGYRTEIISYLENNNGTFDVFDKYLIDKLKTKLKKGESDIIKIYISVFKMYVSSENISQEQFCKISDKKLSSDKKYIEMLYDTILSGTDTICYDFDVMDRLLLHIKTVEPELSIVLLDSEKIPKN